MSANSTFRDLPGERDPIHTESRTTPAVASGTRVREWRVRVADKSSLTRLDVMYGTAGQPGSARLMKFKVWSCPSGGVLSGYAAKGYAQVTMTSGASAQAYTLHTLSAITLPAGSVVAFALVTGNPTGGVGMKLGVYLTKGHVQA